MDEKLLMRRFVDRDGRSAALIAPAALGGCYTYTAIDVAERDAGHRSPRSRVDGRRRRSSVRRSA